MLRRRFKRLIRFGKRLMLKRKRLLFDNRQFWNKRYTKDIGLGSGPGSRGTLLMLKRDLIHSHVCKHGVRSTIDLGCGDVEVIRVLDIDRYHGIDISDVVVKRNRLLRPDWTFECASIPDIAIDRSYDLTLCLDVLIHQKRRADYERIIGKIRAIDSPVILVSGYQAPPESWNVFYHEPLSESLARLIPERRFEIIAAYRDTTLFASVTLPPLDRRDCESSIESMTGTEWRNQPFGNTQASVSGRRADRCCGRPVSRGAHRL